MFRGTDRGLRRGRGREQGIGRAPKDRLCGRRRRDRAKAPSLPGRRRPVRRDGRCRGGCGRRPCPRRDETAAKHRKRRCRSTTACRIGSAESWWCAPPPCAPSQGQVDRAAKAGSHRHVPGTCSGRSARRPARRSSGRCSVPFPSGSQPAGGASNRAGGGRREPRSGGRR